MVKKTEKVVFNGFTKDQENKLNTSFAQDKKSRDEVFSTTIGILKEIKFTDMNRTERAKVWSTIWKDIGAKTYKSENHFDEVIKKPINDELGTGYKKKSGTPKAQDPAKVKEILVKKLSKVILSAYVQLSGLIGERELKRLLSQASNNALVANEKAGMEASKETRRQVNA